MIIDEYMDQARERCRIGSDRGLARALRVNATTTNGWRLKRQWPSDEVMVRLAELAGVDARVAILELNLWRSKSATATSVYSKILLTIGNAAAIALLITSIAIACPTGTFADQSRINSGAMYIMGNLRRYLRTAYCAVFSII